MKNSIENALKSIGEHCTGCSACVNACSKMAISMQEDERGFVYPTIDQQCIGCGMCVKSCPEINLITKRNPLYYYGATYIEQNKIRESSSGGIFFAIAEYVLHNEGYVVGVELTDDFTVQHTIINSSKEIMKLCGSKYVQSSTTHIYKQVKSLLRKGKIVLFTGVPCQIAGLLSYIGENTDNLITVELLCHGVPNNRVFQDYIEGINVRHGKITKYSFRDRTLGMHGSNVHIWLDNGREIINTPEINSFDRLYSRGYLMRESCFSCKYSTKKRIGDFVVGDFWGIEKTYDNWDTDKGASVVIINSDIAISIWEKIEQKLMYFETDFESCKQDSMTCPASKPSDYEYFWKCYKRKGFEFCVDRFGEYSIRSKTNKMFKRAKRLMISHLRRI